MPWRTGSAGALDPTEIAVIALLAAIVILATLKFRNPARWVDALLLAGLLGAAALLVLVMLD